MPAVAKRPELHYATDRRCYYGAWSSDMLKQFKSQDDIIKALREVEPNLVYTYFPDCSQREHGYLVSIKRGEDEGREVPLFREVSGNFHNDKGEALLEAWDILIGAKQDD